VEIKRLGDELLVVQTQLNCLKTAQSTSRPSATTASGTNNTIQQSLEVPEHQYTAPEKTSQNAEGRKAPMAAPATSHQSPKPLTHDVVVGKGRNALKLPEPRPSQAKAPAPPILPEDNSRWSLQTTDPHLTNNGSPCTLPRERNQNSDRKREREPASDTSEPSKRPKTNITSPERGSTCGACAWRQWPCDGAFRCRNCRRKGWVCAYRLCKHGNQCKGTKCTYLHRGQYSQDEKPERLIEGVNYKRGSVDSDR